MSKITSIEVPSDDCAVAYGGEIFHPHEGERVWLWPDHSLGLLTTLNEFNQLQTRVLELKGEPDEAAGTLALVQSAYSSLARLLAPCLDRWDWTDKRGAPMAPLDGTAGPLQCLEVEELQWLARAVTGDTPAARKNGLKPSRITSSATE